MSDLDLNSKCRQNLLQIFSIIYYILERVFALFLCACSESADITKSRWNPVSKRSEVRKLHFCFPQIRKGGRSWLRSHTYSEETNESSVIVSINDLADIISLPRHCQTTLCVFYCIRRKRKAVLYCLTITALGFVVGADFLSYLSNSHTVKSGSLQDIFKQKPLHIMPLKKKKIRIES